MAGRTAPCTVLKRGIVRFGDAAGMAEPYRSGSKVASRADPAQVPAGSVAQTQWSVARVIQM